jgi:hypothetical protein
VATAFNSGGWKLFVNGAEVASKTSAVTTIFAGTANLLVGRDDGASHFFPGLIDELAVYNRALTAAEIRGIYNAGAAGKDSATPIITSVLPGLIARSAAFSHRLTAALGTAPYAYALHDGALPAGLALTPDGVLSGIPTTVATNNFSVRVTDAASQTSVKAFSVVVNAALITGNVTLAANNTTYENLPVTVAAGATLTVAGQHHFTSLIVAGTLTHTQGDATGVNLVVDGAVVIEPNGSIDVSGRGLRGGREGGLGYVGEWWNNGSPAANPNGATYGETLAYANPMYGDPHAPNELGSGGGAWEGFSDIRPHGGNGGGRLFLTAHSLEVNGGIYANGTSSYGGPAYGGSGGAIRVLLDGGTLSGGGIIQAAGGAGDVVGNKGGGGRVAISGYSANAFTGTVGPSGSLNTSTTPRDSNGDGLSDAAEYLHGTNLNLPPLTLRISKSSLSPVLLWPVTLTAYRVESTLSLSSPIAWSNVTGAFQTNGGSISLVLPIVGTNKFYRLVTP